MSTPDENQTENPQDPHGIDQDREKRLVKIFIGFIGAAFVLVLIMLSVAFALDMASEEEPVPTPPPAWDPETPDPPKVPGSHP